MSNRTLSDQEARNAIISIFDRNFLVEAGAGSGKTTSLVKRMVEAVKCGKCRVEEIAAITFTKKAASELWERFQTYLEKEVEASQEEKEKKNLAEALENIDQCFIGTVHSFCARLLRERPVEAGIDPAFEELDEIKDILLKKQAWESYLSMLKLSNDPILGELEEIGISPLDLFGSYEEMNSYPDVEVMTQKTVRPDITKALQEVYAYLDKTQPLLPVFQNGKGDDALQGAIRKALRLRRYTDDSKDSQIIGILSIFDRNLSVTQNRWPSKQEAKDSLAEANALSDRLIQPLMSAWREYCHFYITQFLKPAVRHYEEMRYRLSLLNFQDLLMKTAATLKSNPEVRRYFQNKYRHLLVDEFQDTDPIQAEIIFYLTGEDNSEKNWQKLVPKPGALFVVGDPKQSIYRFRRADIDIYNLVKDLILKSGGDVLKLTSNFRSVNAIAGYLNPIFKEILPQEKDRYQAQFAPMETIREDKTGTALGVKSLLICAESSKKDDVVREDAETIAKVIRDAVDGNMRLSRTEEERLLGMTEHPLYKDFMILLRYKDSISVYARMLEKYGIPVNMAGGSNVGESIEIQELLKLLQLLCDMDNQVWLIAVLRGRFFGLSDNTLYKFKAQGGTYNVYLPISKDVEEKFRSEMGNAFDKLKQYHHWTRSFSPTVALEKIILDTGIIQYVALLEMNRSRCSEIYNIIERLKMEESGGITQFQEMVGMFETILEASVEEELDIFCEDDKVRIMNLHKAKGLESPVVFLAHPAKKASFSPSSHVERIDDQPRGYFTFKKSGSGYSSATIGEPVDWKTHQAEEQMYLDAEENRLVYVAATRAKNLLVISSGAKPDKNPWSLLLTDTGKIEALSVPQISPPEEANGFGCLVDIEDYREVRQNCSNWAMDLEGESYAKASPTDYKDLEAFWNIGRNVGGGMDWGSAVHQVMEHLVQGTPDLSGMMEMALKKNGIDVQRKAELVGLVEKFQQTNLWKRIQASDEKYTEIPFSLRLDENHPLFHEFKKEEGIPIIMAGVMDLIFREDEEWIVVDYKTDRVKNNEDYKKLEAVYKTQVELYGHVLEEMTGQKVKEREIVFLSRD